MGFTDYYVVQQQQGASSGQQRQHSPHVPGGGPRPASRAGSSSGKGSDIYCPFDDDDDDGGDQLDAAGDGSASKLSDQEILESTEAIYFDAGSSTGLHELKVRSIYFFKFFK